MENNPSTPEEIRAKALARAFEPPVIFTLPSGIRLRVQRPKPLWWILNQESLPTSLSAKMLGQEPAKKDKLEPEELLQFAKFSKLLFDDLVLEPKFGTEPGQADPRLIDDEDFAALIRFAGGETTADGASLEPFREQSDSVDTGQSSKPLENSTQPVA